MTKSLQTHRVLAVDCSTSVGSLLCREIFFPRQILLAASL